MHIYTRFNDRSLSAIDKKWRDESSFCLTAQVRTLLRCHHVRTLRFRNFFELRLKATLEHAIKAVEVDVDDRCDVERQQLRETQTADDCDAKRLT